MKHFALILIKLCISFGDIHQIPRLCGIKPELLYFNHKLLCVPNIRNVDAKFSKVCLRSEIKNDVGYSREPTVFESSN